MLRTVTGRSVLRATDKKRSIMRLFSVNTGEFPSPVPRGYFARSIWTGQSSFCDYLFFPSGLCAGGAGDRAGALPIHARQTLCCRITPTAYDLSPQESSLSPQASSCVCRRGEYLSGGGGVCTCACVCARTQEANLGCHYLSPIHLVFQRWSL